MFRCVYTVLRTCFLHAATARVNQGEKDVQGCPALWTKLNCILGENFLPFLMQNTHLRATDPFLSANWPFSTILAHAGSQPWRSAWSKWCKRRGCAVKITSKCKTDARLIFTKTDKADSSLATVSLFLRGVEITQEAAPISRETLPAGADWRRKIRI